ncbi:MAG: hypothetical protein AAGA91_16650 [Pseudomonadota bacterium]
MFDWTDVSLGKPQKSAASAQRGPESDATEDVIQRCPSGRAHYTEWLGKTPPHEKQLFDFEQVLAVLDGFA